MPSRKYYILLGLIPALLVLNGCAASRGFNRGQLRESLEHAVSVNDDDIKEALERKPQLPKPFKLGIYFVESESGRMPRNSNVVWRWTEQDRDQIFRAADDLKATGEVNDVFPISAGLVSGSDLRSIRLAAAKHGADALLVVSGVSDTDAYTNNMAWSYFLLLPMLFVPGSQTDVLFIARAAMWDVRNEFLYLTAESESINQRESPLAFIKERDQVVSAKHDAVVKLAEELKRQVANVKHEPQKAQAR